MTLTYANAAAEQLNARTNAKSVTSELVPGSAVNAGFFPGERHSWGDAGNATKLETMLGSAGLDPDRAIPR
jgi:hypothetical protein